MNVRGFLALPVFVALLLGGAIAQSKADEKDKDKAAKKPIGTWKRAQGDVTVVLTVTEKEVLVTVKSDKLDLDFEADYSLSKDNFYACIRKVKEGDEKLTGELFGFVFEAGDDELVMSKFKGTGAVALGGLFMNGKYRKEASKKD